MSLNLNSNNIRDIDEVCALNKLPMLQSVDLTDNPITSEPDYRSQILGRIPNRINDVVVSKKTFCTMQTQTPTICFVMDHKLC